MPPSAEEFARWRDDRVTRWIFKAIEQGVAANKKAWDDASWGAGVGNPDNLAKLLAELRTRSDAYRALIDTTYEGWAEMNGDEAVYDRQ